MTEVLPRAIGEKTCKPEQQYLAWLCDRKHLFRGAIRRLLHHFGSAEAVYHERLGRVQAVLGSDTFQKVNWQESVEEHIALLEKEGVIWIGAGEAGYPEGFRSLAVPPIGIFVKGRRELLKTAGVGIVGARLCSSYGRETALRLARGTAQAGVTVVSGMAAGIDRAAHEGALAAEGATIAVLGCGVLRCYPHENRRLYEMIAEQGCLISEYGLHQEPLAFCFPERNRLIAGLVEKLVIVEARKERSGAMITVDCALEQGKEVYAVPGSMWSVLSAGTHNLINQGAMLLETVDMLLPDRSSSAKREDDGKAKETESKADKERGKETVRPMMNDRTKAWNERERKIWETLGEQAMSLEELIRASGMSLAELQDGLFQLLLEEEVLEVAKHHYVRRQ
ncbi:MAG: DNA-processing protein DprA [Eubacteriales bacterium]|nr:DNA-processing protein DprA [Eubacteriales bacterium]